MALGGGGGVLWPGHITSGEASCREGSEGAFLGFFFFFLARGGEGAVRLERIVPVVQKG